MFQKDLNESIKTGEEEVIADIFRNIWQEKEKIFCLQLERTFHMIVETALRLSINDWPLTRLWLPTVAVLDGIWEA